MALELLVRVAAGPATVRALGSHWQSSRGEAVIAKGWQRLIMRSETIGWRDISVLLLVWVGLLACVAVAAADGTARLVHYRSPVDNSSQAYGVYVPDGPAPAEGYPVVLHAHGYGWSVNKSFSGWQKDWADAHRWILVKLNARGPNFYWGIGDVATREVLQDLEARYGIDERRVYITGGSMGGTGAYRQGIVHPDYIAAAVGVDGWTDFHKWHHHWYARKDQRDDIEEFRRPLLEASSPLFLAERARWGDVYVIADKKDTVVIPEQGIDLGERLSTLAEQQAGTYDSGMTVNPGKGHGGGYSVSWIYDYFLGRSLKRGREDFAIATPVLDHGQMYWGRMERLQFQGQMATLECSLSSRPWEGVDRALGHPRLPAAPRRPRVQFPPRRSLLDTVREREERALQTGVVHVRADNLDAFGLDIGLSRAADLERIAVYAEGMPCYVGPPRELGFEARRDYEDRLTGWSAFDRSVMQADRVHGINPLSNGPVHPSKPGSSDRWPPAKTGDISGPVGDAFTEPFVVCYGTLGSDADVNRHREEAVAFCQGWNDFMVHGPGLEAMAEEELSPGHIKRRNLVVYGTVDTSDVLKRAQAIHALPVEVRSDSVVVHDPLTGDRRYRGEKFGTFFVYPNPLTAGRTYLVICNGRFATKPDGSAVKGLEYDLEKLYWAYADYVIFNCDQRDLPHVKSVNNKAPVTCYDGGYFVEAGYFDARWRPDRWVTVDRVKRTKPDSTRLIHVAEVCVEKTDKSLPVFEKIDGEPKDPPRERLDGERLCATVKIVDESGKPVRQARVTGQWVGMETDSISRPTLSGGVAYFPYEGDVAGEHPRFRVLNVMATGAAYDFEADCLAGSSYASADGAIGLRPSPVRHTIDPRYTVAVSFDVANLSAESCEVSVEFLPPNGTVVSQPDAMHLRAGEKRCGTVRWRPEQGLPEGRYKGAVQASAPGCTIARPVQFRFPCAPSAPVQIVRVEPKDIYHVQDYEIKAKVHNYGKVKRAVTLACTILPNDRLLPAREIELPPGEVTEVVWRPSGGEEPLSSGAYTAVVCVLGETGIARAADFDVK